MLATCRCEMIRLNLGLPMPLFIQWCLCPEHISDIPRRPSPGAARKQMSPQAANSLRFRILASSATHCRIPATPPSQRTLPVLPPWQTSSFVVFLSLFRPSPSVPVDQAQVEATHPQRPAKRQAQADKALAGAKHPSEKPRARRQESTQKSEIDF